MCPMCRDSRAECAKVSSNDRRARRDSPYNRLGWWFADAATGHAPHFDGQGLAHCRNKVGVCCLACLCGLRAGPSSNEAGLGRLSRWGKLRRHVPRLGGSLLMDHGAGWAVQGPLGSGYSSSGGRENRHQAEQAGKETIGGWQRGPVLYTVACRHAVSLLERAQWWRG